MKYIVTAREPGEVWEFDGGTYLTGVHERTNCEAGSCVMHQPTDHHMSGWPLIWRNDRSIFERICEHAIGHPDPDQFEYWDRRGFWSEDVHGCDGCCV